MKSTLDLFQNERFADAEVIIMRTATCRDSEDSETGSESSHQQEPQEAQEGPEELKRFPGHLAFLCQSEYFDAQIKFLTSAGSPGGNKPVLTFTVDDDGQLEAAEAVIAALYNPQQRLQDLQQPQLVHAVHFADVMMVQHIALQAVSTLLDQVTTDGLQPTMLAALRSTWPGGMTGQPEFDSKMQAVLMAGFGNLETVWADSQLREQLLALPLPGVVLLLSSDTLEVYSEDTVLYTAARYVKAQPEEQQEEARVQLEEVIRAPHLSDFQLTAQVVNTDTSNYSVLQNNKQCGNLGSLMTIRRCGTATPELVKDQISAAPDSWQLPPRSILALPASGVSLVWHVPVSDIKAAYETSTQGKSREIINSNNCTPPLYGLAWKMYLSFCWDEQQQGVKIGLYSKLAGSYPQGVCYKYCSEVAVGGSHFCRPKDNTKIIRTSSAWGSPSFFGSVITGEWQDSTWVRTLQLPTDGELEFKLSVYSVV